VFRFVLVTSESIGPANYPTQPVTSCHGGSNWIKLRPYSEHHSLSVQNCFGAAQRDDALTINDVLGKNARPLSGESSGERS
jgi:hypothetical protein